MRRALIVALVGCVACSGDDQPRAAPASPQPATAQQTLAVLRAFVTARDVPDQLGKLLAPDVIAAPGDPTGGTPIYGRDALVTSRRKRGATWRDRCVLEVELAAAGEAIGIAHCAGTLAVKQPPLERHRAITNIYDVVLDANGLVANATTWWDVLRTYRQLGAALDVDARPDEPTGTVVTIVAKGDEVEASHERHAREIITALDRRETAVVEQRIGDGYVEHRLVSAAPQTFATAAAFARDEIGGCETSRYRVQSTLAAGDWVAVRFGKNCRVAEREAYASHLWLMRFAGDRVREGWRAAGIYETERQLGRTDVPATSQKLRAAGL